MNFKKAWPLAGAMLIGVALGATVMYALFAPSPTVIAPGTSGTSILPQSNVASSSPSLFQKAQEFFSAPTTYNCHPDIDVDVAGLPERSPSGSWCQLSGYPVCDAAWCNGYWGDGPTAAQSSVLYNCNIRQPNSNEGTCQAIAAVALPTPTTSAADPSDCTGQEIDCSRGYNPICRNNRWHCEPL